MVVLKYQRKAETVEAVHFTGFTDFDVNNPAVLPKEMRDFIGCHDLHAVRTDGVSFTFRSTYAGTQRVEAGEWLVRNEKGQYSIHGNDAFQQLFEPVPAVPDPQFLPKESAHVVAEGICLQEAGKPLLWKDMEKHSMVECRAPITIFAVGSKVLIVEDIEGTVQSVLFGDGDITYNVAWWDGRSRQVQTFNACDVKSVNRTITTAIGFRK
jgi:hypothetical protein